MKMVTRYLCELGKGSCNCIMEDTDGSLVAYVNEKLGNSTDGGYSWTANREKGEGLSLSWLRLKNGNVLSVIYNPQSELVKSARMNGTSFDVGIYSPDMTKLLSRKLLTDPDGCFYVQNDRILRLSSGRIIIAVSRHPDESLGAGLEKDCIVASYYSDDEGETWSCSNWVGKNEQENMVVEPGDGRLLMFTRNGYGFMHYFVSKDMGASWDPAVQSTPLRMPMAPFAVKRDPYSGYVFAVWDNSVPASPKPQLPRCPISLAVSTDCCHSWKFIQDLDNNPDDNYGYPCIHFTKESVLVTYYEMTDSRDFIVRPHRNKLQILPRDEICYDVITRRHLF